MFVVLHWMPTEADGAEENRAGSRNVLFMRALMSVAVTAGSCARASREFQREVEVISDSAARVIVIEIGKKKRKKRKGPGNTIDEIVSEVILSKAFMLKQLCQLKKYSGGDCSVYVVERRENGGRTA